MVVEELIQDEDRPTLMRALLLRHRHVNENAQGVFPFGSRRKFSSYTSLQVSKVKFFNGIELIPFILLARSAKQSSEIVVIHRHRELALNSVRR